MAAVVVSCAGDCAEAETNNPVNSITCLRNSPLLWRGAGGEVGRILNKEQGIKNDECRMRNKSIINSKNSPLLGRGAGGEAWTNIE